jgi:serine/threonine protein phosphatase PrpC
MPMRIDAAGLTDVGLQRDHNEDAFAVEPSLNLFIVADGMGGHQAGDVASKIAVEATVDFFRSTGLEDLTWPFEFDPKRSEEENRLISGVKLANRRIVELGSRRPELHGMGTTIVAALFAPKTGRLYIAHVGDSRAYRVRRGKIQQLTRDHSLVNDYADAMPEMSEEQRGDLPTNVITRALGMQDNVPVDVAGHDVQVGDVYLLCSDGLSGMVEDDELAELIDRSASNLSGACRLLINVANEHGGEDNVTAVLLRADPVTPDEVRATVPDLDD